MVTTSALVALLLVGIVVYAATHQGSGTVTALTKADRSGPRVHITKVAQRQHVTTAVTYNQSPPVGGPHNGVPQTCQVYNQPIANEHAVHSMEHGAVWTTYRPGMDPAQIRTLQQLAQGNPYRLLSPYPGLTAPIHVFVDVDKITGVVDWSEAGQGDALYDLASLTLGHEERLGDVVAGHGTHVDLDVIRAWWSLRSLRAVRWLVEHGFDPWPEVAVLRSRL